MKRHLTKIIILAVAIAAIITTIFAQKAPPWPLPPTVDFQQCGSAVMQTQAMGAVTNAWQQAGCTDFHFRDINGEYVFGYATRITLVDP